MLVDAYRSTVDAWYTMDPARQNIHFVLGMAARVRSFVLGLKARGYRDVVVLACPFAVDVGDGAPPHPFAPTFVHQDALLVDAFASCDAMDIHVYTGSTRADVLCMMRSLVELPVGSADEPWETHVFSRSLDLWVLRESVPALCGRVFTAFDTSGCGSPSIDLIVGNRASPTPKQAEFFSDMQGMVSMREEADRALWIASLDRAHHACRRSVTQASLARLLDFSPQGGALSPPGSPVKRDANGGGGGGGTPHGVADPSAPRRTLVLPQSDRSPTFFGGHSAWMAAIGLIAWTLGKKGEDLERVDIEVAGGPTVNARVAGLTLGGKPLAQGSQTLPTDIAGIIGWIRDCDRDDAWHATRDMARCTIAAQVCLSLETIHGHNNLFTYTLGAAAGAFNVQSKPGSFLKKTVDALLAVPSWIETPVDALPRVFCVSCGVQFTYQPTWGTPTPRPTPENGRAEPENGADGSRSTRYPQNDGEDEWKLVTKSGNLPVPINGHSKERFEKKRSFPPTRCGECSRK